MLVQLVGALHFGEHLWKFEWFDKLHAGAASTLGCGYVRVLTLRDVVIVFGTSEYVLHVHVHMTIAGLEGYQFGQKRPPLSDTNAM